MKRGLQYHNKESSRLSTAKGSLLKDVPEITQIPMPWDDMSPPELPQQGPAGIQGQTPPLGQGPQQGFPFNGQQDQTPLQPPVGLKSAVFEAMKPRVFVRTSGGEPLPPAFLQGLPSWPGDMQRMGAGGTGRQLLTETLKRQRRLEKNRESARECRRRKKERIERMNTEIAEMEHENHQLRLRLKIGTEATKRERREKQSVLEKLQEKLGKGATDAELSTLIHDYKDKFSDYGKDRTSALEFHLKELEKLVLPTNTTRLCIWGMGHAGDFISKSKRGGAEKKMIKKEDPEEVGVGLTVRREEQKQAARKFWNELSTHLGLSSEQQRAIIGHRHSVCDLEEDLDQLHKVIDQLRQLITNKNEALDKEMEDLQQILTPTQIAKFMLWVKQNPGCMYMLNQLWKQVYKNTKSS